ncbi:MAG: hypothetical protein EOO40_04110 [Deltaproteobacteria bacterium]|nr:MAG: hypothetical protein EOO40_04110 [Deltaproteobacteria bacterium]
MDKASQLIVSHDLSEFFRGEVIAARENLRIDLSEGAEYYLVNLLCAFSSQVKDRAPTNEPLAFIYKKATEVPDAQKVQQYKYLGDVALYVAGFFTDSIERSLVDVDYYISMGGTAYHSLSALVGNQRHGEQLAQLYTQLALRFVDLVDVLNQISARSFDKAQRDTDLLKLYDRYARTGSERIRRLLLARGLLPSAAVPTDYIQ